MIKLTNCKHLTTFEALLQPGIALISGPSGSGKTSLLDGIWWCLTGKGSHDIAAICGNLPVEAHFELNGLSLLRQKNPIRICAQKHETKFFGISAQAVIDEHLVAAYVTQCGFDSFLISSAAERKCQLEQLAGIDTIGAKIMATRKTELNSSSKESLAAAHARVNSLGEICTEIDSTIVHDKSRNDLAELLIAAKHKYHHANAQTGLAGMTFDEAIIKIDELKKMAARYEWEAKIKVLTEIVDGAECANKLLSTGLSEKTSIAKRKHQDAITLEELGTMNRWGVNVTCPCCNSQLLMTDKLEIGGDQISFKKRRTESQEAKYKIALDHGPECVSDCRKQYYDLDSKLTCAMRASISEKDLTSHKSKLSLLKLEHEKFLGVNGHVDPKLLYSLEAATQQCANCGFENCAIINCKFDLNQIMAELEQVYNFQATFEKRENDQTIYKKFCASKQSLDNVIETRRRIEVCFAALATTQQKRFDSVLAQLESRCNMFCEKLFDGCCLLLQQDGAKIEILLRQGNVNLSISRLSGGEKSRLSLAFTLALCEMRRCKILLLDECLSGLDEAKCSTVIEMLREWSKQHDTIVLCSLHRVAPGLFDYEIKM